MLLLRLHPQCWPVATDLSRASAHRARTTICFYPNRVCDWLFWMIFKSVRLVVLLVSLISGSRADAEQHEGVLPNFLFILSDDQTFDAIGRAGAWSISTPNLDRLAQRGTTFSHVYNMGAWNGAVCVASRTMLNTGRSVWRAYAASERLDAEIQEGRLWSQLMSKAGYETYFSGKWHLQSRAEPVFDHCGTTTPGMMMTDQSVYYRPGKATDDPWTPDDPKWGGYWQDGVHLTQKTADEGIAFLRQANAQSRPYFLYLGFNAPHDPRQAPRRFVDAYPSDTIELPPNFLPEYPYAEQLKVGRGMRDEQLAPHPRTEAAVKLQRAEYFAIISHLDEQVGRVLDELEALGGNKNTIVIFTSDHGLSVGSHGFLGKQNMYEHALRVPLIIAGPGVAANAVIDTRIYLQDIMPTTLRLARAEIPAYVEFLDLVPMMKGDPARHHATIYSAYMGSQRMLIRDGYKVIAYPEIDVLRLYDLEKDPHERVDLAGTWRGKLKLVGLKRALRKMEKQMKDPIITGQFEF